MTESENKHVEDARILLQKIRECDAVCVGAASGMSASGGHNFWYERDETFVNVFGEFEKRYGFHSAFKGLYYKFITASERWAYIATLCHLLYELPATQPYHDLFALLKDKNYFIVTTNQDMQFRELFPEDRLSTIQGDWGYFQCYHACHDKVYPNKEIVYKLYENIDDCKVPREMIPRCPECGCLMWPWVRGPEFLEGSKYNDEYEKWNKFIDANREKKILFLELGVGRMTPMFIQHPFWEFVYTLPDAYYISINPWDALIPNEISNKGHIIKNDIALIFRECIQLMKDEEQKTK